MQIIKEVDLSCVIFLKIDCQKVGDQVNNRKGSRIEICWVVSTFKIGEKIFQNV